MTLRSLWLACAAALLVGLALSGAGASVRAQAQRCVSGFTCDDPEWRFTYQSRRVKVVLLAGSIGAFQDQPYGRLIHEWCENAEVRNLSRVGYGAFQLYQVFRQEVVQNPRFPHGAQGLETWVWWNGGLNSAASANRTNRYIRRVFTEAHRRGMRVVGMTLTPWGALEDERRWGGTRGLDTLRNTRRIVDFVMGRSAPRDALGTYVSDREAPDAPWTTNELADVRIDLFDSSLRHASAPLRDLAQMRQMLARDARYQRQIEALPEAERPARMEADAQTLAELPRWFLRPEIRGFDPVHPNRDGHREIALLACPRLPASWGCRCPSR
jgi:hypothetical protein